MEPQLKVDPSEALSFFQNLEAYTPQATALALNRTAEWGTKEGRDRAPSVFKVREPKALMFAFPVIIPGKERANPRRLEVAIEPQRIGRIYGPYEEGSPHVPDRWGRWPAVPSKALRVTPMTKIPRQMYPSNLGLVRRVSPKGDTYYALGRGSIRKKLTPVQPDGRGGYVKQGRFGTYEVPAKDGSGFLIFQRKQGPARAGGAGAGSVLLWKLKPRVERPKQLRYFASISDAAGIHWPLEMKAAFERYRDIAANRAARR